LSNRKIAHQPGYELKKDPDTGARRWHAVMKKRPNPATGELVEEPALFEEVPDATEGDAAVEWLKARGVALYPGGSFDLPDPDDFVAAVPPGEEGRVAKLLVTGFEGGDFFGFYTPSAFPEWLGEVAGQLAESGLDASLDHEAAISLLDFAWKGLYANDGRRKEGALIPIAALALSSLDADDFRRWVEEGWGDGRIGAPSLPKAIENATYYFEGVGNYSDKAGEVIDDLEGWLEEALNDHDTLIDASGYQDRASIMAEQRLRVLPSVVEMAGMGGGDDDESIDALAGSDEAFRGFLDNLIDGRLKEWDRWGGDDPYKETAKEIRDNYADMDSDGRQILREKFATFVKGAHKNPAIATNRLPGAAAHILRDGEYAWREVDGASDTRFLREESLGLGRVVYGAYAHTDAVPYAGGSYSDIGAAIHRDPAVVNLGTDGWGRTRLLWAPHELTEGGTSFAFNDIGLVGYDDVHRDDMNFENSAILAALVHAYRSTDHVMARSLSRYSPAFTEIHLNRPLKVDGDLAGIFTPLTDDGVFPYLGFDTRGVDGIVDSVRNYRYGDLAMATTMAKAAPPEVPVNLVAPWLDSEPIMKLDPTGQATQDLIGGIQEVLEKDWGDKMKLWVPEGLRKE